MLPLCTTLWPPARSKTSCWCRHSWPRPPWPRRSATRRRPHTALLFLERDTATLAVVDSADGAISDVHKELIPGDSVAELAGMLAGLEELETQPAERVHRRYRRGRRCDQAAIGDADGASCHRGRGTGDRAGLGRGAGVGQRAVVCLVDRGPRVRARPGYRGGRSLCGVAGIPCSTGCSVRYRVG